MKKSGRKPREFNIIERQVILHNYYNLNKSAAEVAKEFNVSESTLRRRLRKWNSTT